MARSSSPKPRAPRLLPPPVKLGAEPDAFAPVTQADEEVLASLVYISGASPGYGDSNYQVSTFINSLTNSTYSAYINGASGVPV